jgi:hypothetical protein
MNPKTGRVVAAIAVAAAALLTPDTASAGPYRVSICNPDLGAQHADVTFHRTSNHYLPDAGCAKRQPGLEVSHDGSRTGDGRWGAWTLRAPRGTVISHLGVSTAGRGGGGLLPQLLALPAKGVVQAFAAPDPGVERSRFTGPTRMLMARLSCRRVSGCRGAAKAHVRIKRLALELRDGARPTIALGGAALRRGSRRGVQPLAVAATDVGGGVHRFLVQVNGQPLNAHTSPCRARDRWALRLRPCPARARTAFKLQTTAAPFRQGPNTLRVCSSDYAIGGTANRACAARRIRVDNLCPVSATGAGPRLEAHLIHEHGRAGVRGRLVSASGDAISGARVCVATRVPIAGNVEHVVTTPATSAEGRFAADLPPGPSRNVRVAYWRNAAEVTERYLHLSVHAHPRLALRPQHPLRNGRHVRFKVTLPGPAAHHRWVRIQARSGHRWVEVRNGRTNARGVYRARYRFHATTGRQRYAFRAFVPSQHGYPYERGHSRVRRVTVIG